MCATICLVTTKFLIGELMAKINRQKSDSFRQTPGSQVHKPSALKSLTNNFGYSVTKSCSACGHPVKVEHIGFAQMIVCDNVKCRHVVVKKY
jgi:hypothetical protein